MANPVLVEVTRGGRAESRHRGAIAVVDAQGKPLLTLGDVEAPVFPRSAVKAIQALPLVELGAADHFGFQARELALAQASHGGEPAHVACAAAMLAAIGLDEHALECGAHAPSHIPSSNDLVRRGRAPSQLHNNCSGKHAGFLAVCQHRAYPHHGYVDPHHPVQADIREALQSVTGAAHDAEHCGTDGCSIPTYAVPLTALATGFARFGTGVGLSRERAAAAHRIYEAAVSEPFYVAGTGRFCTEVMTLMKGAAQVKTGAEGVFCGALAGPRPGRGAEMRRRRRPRRRGDDGGGACLAPAGARRGAEALERGAGAHPPRRPRRRGARADGSFSGAGPMNDNEQIELEEGDSKGRYVLRGANGALAEMTFSKAGPHIVIIDHTEVPDAFRGQGVGVRLVGRAVADARAAGKTIIPLCPFANAQFKKHPEWADVLNK